MSLNQKIIKDLKDAMKAKDSVRVSCLRMLIASLKNLQVEKRQELNDDEMKKTILSSVRKCKEALEEFRKAGREDLAIKEEQEIQILYEYLPRQLTPEEIEKTLQEIISELSAESSKDMGNVMKVAMARMAGMAQGKEVSEIARKLLK
ncbi:MAG: GatB/YqeY domain-containing protein [Deltaproteobacteria bacterium]|nr:GatB/YqeY domain-containing protein [Deltaproteobacteria bacterium]